MAASPSPLPPTPQQPTLPALPVQEPEADRFLTAIRELHRVRDLIEAVGREEVLMAPSGLKDAWVFKARREQLPPIDLLRTWIFLGGRGAGKTISLTSAAHLAAQSGIRKIMLIAPTAADVRDILIEGRAGLLNTAPAGFRPRFVETRRKLVWPNGAEALCFSAAEPEFLRGHEAELCLIDEWAAMDYGADVLDQASLCLRIGNPHVFIATTPQPKPWLKKLLKAPGVIVTHSTTWANEKNLAPSYIADLRETWAGRKLALQELEGLIVEEEDAELFKESWLIHHEVPLEMIERVSIGVDPGGIDTTGIVACAYLVDGRYAVLARSQR